MAEIKMGVVESHFADIIWANEPLHSRDLVKLCEKELNWNRPPPIPCYANSVSVGFSKTTEELFPLC